jgi:hypothetical protein
MSIEQKIVEAAQLIKEAARELEKLGLLLDFEIWIKFQPPTVSLTVSNDNSPSAK